LRRIVRAPGSTFDNPDQQRIAGNLIDSFDDLVQKIDIKNVAAGDPKAAVSALKQAREVYSQSRKVGIIEDLVKSAEIRSSRQSQSGFDNTLRDRFVSLADNKRRMAAFSKSERAEIENIAKGGGNIEQMLRFVGRFAIRGPVTGIMGGLAMGADATLGGGMALTAEAAKRSAEAMRMQNIE
jgi:hypothetical protein